MRSLTGWTTQVAGWRAPVPGFFEGGGRVLRGTCRAFAPQAKGISCQHRLL